MKDAILLLIFLGLLLAVVEGLRVLHPEGAAKLLQSRTFRVFRMILLVIVGVSVIVLAVVLVIFGGIAIVQDIGTSGQGGCQSVNCQ